ncbi:MAG TPA: sigma-70 family RNA polymerase sigma factor [Chitinophagaceae bacterium]
MFQEGNEEALSYFYREYHPALTLFAHAHVRNFHLAQEIASEAFLKVWRLHSKLDNYQGIRAYLYKTVLRDSKRARFLEVRRTQFNQDTLTQPGTEDSPFSQLIRAETYRIVHSALKSLPPGYRKVISMHFIDGKSTGEIARELNASVSTVKTQKQKGLKALKKRMSKPPLFDLIVTAIIYLLSR